MISAIAPISALLASVFILFLGNGLQGTILPIRGYAEAFTSLELGVLGAVYYAGFTIGCVVCPMAIKRAGHIRAFAVFTTVASSSAILHAMIVHPFAWFAFRGLTGLCFAGIFMVIESWLNEKSTNENRGQLLSIYQIVNFTALTGGQLMLNLANPGGFELFALVTVLVSLAIVPVSLTTASAPAPVHQVQVRLRWLYKVSPVGAMGCLTVGFANGAFWALAPVFAQRSLLSVSEISYFMSAAIIGGAVLQWPVGRLSDRFDRRYVIAAACAAASLAGLGMGLLGGRSIDWLLALSIVFGGLAFPLYSLCIAHANDMVAPEDRVDVSSGLLLIFGIGAVIGPFAASAIMDAAGHRSLFFYTAAVHVLMAAFALYRSRQRDAVLPEDRDDFIGVSPVSPEVFIIDPRTSDEDAPPPYQRRASDGAGDGAGVLSERDDEA